MIDSKSFYDYGVGAALLVGSVAVLAKLFGVKWLRGLFESEGEPSLRLALAGLFACFGLCEFAARNIDSDALGKICSFVEILLAIGAGKVVASRFAPKPTADPTQQPKPDEPAA